MKILYDQAIPYFNQFFSGHGELLALASDQINAETIREADALFVRSVTRVNQALLANSSVHFVGSATAGIDHIDQHYLQQSNISWCYAPGCNSNAVSDYVLLSIAHLMQNRLMNSTNINAGVIGAGHIGQQVINVLENIGFNVKVSDPIRAEDEVDFLSTPLEEFYDLDFITCHTSLTTDGPHPTYHLLDNKFLSKFNKEGILLNASRGACLDSEALKNSGHTVILDVWENEPNIDLDLMQTAFIATPHIAGYSQAAKYRATKQIFEGFGNHFEIDHEPEVEENPEDYITLNSLENTWVDKILTIENLLEVSKSFKATLQNNKPDIATAFKKFRKAYNFRKEIMMV